MMNDWSNVGHQKRLIEESRGNLAEAAKAARFPVCEQYETPTHVWRCPSPEMQQATALALRELAIFVKPVKTVSIIFQSILAGIKSYMANTPIPDLIVQDNQLGQLLTDAVQEQDDIGWEHCLKGRMSKKWAAAQHKYYAER